MWDRAYGNNLYVLFFLPFWKKWLKNYWHFVTGKTAKSILISCGARLAPFDIKELRDLTAYDELELDTLGEEKRKILWKIWQKSLGKKRLIFTIPRIQGVRASLTVWITKRPERNWWARTRLQSWMAASVSCSLGAWDLFSQTSLI